MKTLTRRELLALGWTLAVSAAAVAYSGISLAGKKTCLEEAQEKPSLRQAYIDQLVRENQIPELGEVLYNPDLPDLRRVCYDVYSHIENAPSFLAFDSASKMRRFLAEETDADGGARIMFTTAPYEIYGRHEKHPLFVHKNAFNPSLIAGEGEFKSVLVDHEFAHVKDIYHGMKIGDFVFDYKNADVVKSGELKSGIVDMLIEFRASHSQLKQILDSRRIVGKTFFEEVKIQYSMMYKGLEQYISNPEGLPQLEMQVIKDQLEMASDIRPESLQAKLLLSQLESKHINMIDVIKI